MSVPPQGEQGLAQELVDRADSPDIHLADGTVVAGIHLVDTQVVAVAVGSRTPTDNRHTQLEYSLGHLGYCIRTAGWVYALEVVRTTKSKRRTEEGSWNPGTKAASMCDTGLGDEEELPIPVRGQPEAVQRD